MKPRKKLSLTGDITQRIIKAQFDRSHVQYLRKELTTTKRQKHGALTKYQKDGLKNYEDNIENNLFTEEAHEQAVTKARNELWDSLNKFVWKIIRKKVDYTGYNKAQIDEKANELYNAVYLIFVKSLWEYDPTAGGFMKYFFRRCTAGITDIQSRENAIEITPSILQSVRQKRAGHPVKNKLYKTDPKFKKEVDFYATKEDVKLNHEGAITVGKSDDGDELTYTPTALQATDSTLKHDLDQVISRWAFECRDDKKLVKFLQVLSTTYDVTEARKESGISSTKANKCLEVLKVLLNDHKKTHE